jgi:predicted Rossmann-fold nucleotide-binding protein
MGFSFVPKLNDTSHLGAGKMVRKIQIGVMGSAADLGYTEAVAKLAEEIGQEVAKAGCTLVFGAEKEEGEH